MGICNQVVTTRKEKNDKENDDLLNKNIILNQNIEHLDNQLKKLKMEILNVENKAINNLNNQYILLTTYNFWSTDSRETQITVSEETTTGYVITKLCENWNIPYTNELVLMNDGIGKSYKTSDNTLFKNKPFDPNKKILVRIY